MKGGVRGKYASQLTRRATIVILAPDVADAFPDSRSVNEALRLLVRAARRNPRKVRRGKRRLPLPARH